ncbi:hypothetical protein A0J57_06705 [Sphingobium sp. 22B]|uniref:oxidoreductase n=1 Tax=unclassified Sphingobium TaxID=2611147 RepID=UPI00078525C2|nr:MULTISPECIES: hypothetical protein [unclassified Sphingobium]KXU32898.1 hypothetical protein AXW74_04735 [Sphingobium sp. AM]KYC33078.1 hypothetical protein A0J57_06705 [Sphingobium sp. 22B]OAP33265.1 hypothetical protein A8O16_05235 [Sphingobium sp. 20006FA]
MACPRLFDPFRIGNLTLKNRIAMAAMETHQDEPDGGVMLHGAHDYPIQQYLSPLMNHRDDIWGGDFERRLRLPAASGVPLDRNRSAAAPPSPAITRLDIISPPRSTATAMSSGWWTDGR